MNSKEDYHIDNDIHPAIIESVRVRENPRENYKEVLYFDHAKIRHMERMLDLFFMLFKNK